MKKITSFETIQILAKSMVDADKKIRLKDGFTYLVLCPTDAQIADLPDTEMPCLITGEGRLLAHCDDDGIIVSATRDVQVSSIECGLVEIHDAGHLLNPPF